MGQALSWFALLFERGAYVSGCHFGRLSKKSRSKDIVQTRLDVRCALCQPFDVPFDNRLLCRSP
jgi:hypothetical protein